MRNLQNNGNYPRSPSGPRKDPLQKRQYQSWRSSTPGNLILRRTNGEKFSNFVPYEQ